MRFNNMPKRSSGVTHLSLSIREVTTPVAVQSRSQVPALLLPLADPAGAKPLDPELKNGHPCRGASFATFGNGLNGFCPTQLLCPREDRSSAGDGGARCVGLCPPTEVDLRENYSRY